jgi:carbamoyltransferase
MRIVAFSVAHDASVCSINDGKLEFFAKEERLSRKKRDNSPFVALDLYDSLKMGKIDKFLYVTPSNIQPVVESMFRSYIRKKFKVELENYSEIKHHASHAALAFNNSKFEESLVFVIDRDGSIFFINGSPLCRESESVYYCNKTQQKEIYKSVWSFNEKDRFSIRTELEKFYANCDINVHNRLSIVKVYEAATIMINESPLENGKTMGLSSYGENLDYYPLFNNGYAIGEYFSHLNNGDESPCFYGDEHLITNVTDQNYRYYANKAKHVQQETQKEALRLIKKYTELTGIKNVCIVGGYGLNVVANNFYIKNCPHLKFYFEPVADDTGISIGACILKNKELNGEFSVDVLDNKFYHYYDWNEKTVLDGKLSNVEELCDLLIQQKSIAIFDGHPEAGPRALGHRSILFDPRNSDAKKIVNEIKNREWYRPFAGVILESEFQKYFDTLGIKSSEFMTVNFDCHLETKNIVPGIIHVDNTCRIQTVSNGFLFELLTAFYKKTGCPMLLNTSFNLAGEPLVQTKQEALETLNNSKLDFVYFVNDNILVEK